VKLFTWLQSNPDPTLCTKLENGISSVPTEGIGAKENAKVRLDESVTENREVVTGVETFTAVTTALTRSLNPPTPSPKKFLDDPSTFRHVIELLICWMLELASPTGTAVF